MATPCVNVEDFKRLLRDSLSKRGFEVYPLKIGWYNAVLCPALRLPYPDDTLGFVVLSTPAMFEQTFLPFLEKQGCKGVSDPIDECVKHCITTTVSQCFPDKKVDVRFDFEMLPNRKPKFVAQTAAHVAGAAYYYQQADVAEHPWGNKKMFGVCVHPELGGWFAIRALLVLGGVEVGSELQRMAPPDCVPTREARIQLLEAFNLCWQDGSYRNIVAPSQTYSQRQRDYFNTRPGQRAALLRDWGYLTGGEETEADPLSDTQGQWKGHG